MLGRISKFIAYLLISMAVGGMLSVLVYYVASISDETKLKKTVKKEINDAVKSFNDAAPHSAPAQTLLFLKLFCNTAMDSKVLAVDPSSETPPPPDQAAHLFAFSAGNRQIDIYIRKAYIKEEVFDLDVPEVFVGIIVTILVFAGLVVYSEKKRQSLVVQEQLETRHAELKKAYEEHEALALLGRMTATLAHELKTPVATISNLVQALPSRISDKKFTSRFVVLAREELNRTQQLIDNLLAYGKEISINNEEWIPLNSFIDELSLKAGITVKKCSKFEISGDLFYLKLLFENLIRNSVQADSDQISIVVQTPSSEGAYAEIFYEDNGVGLPADVAPDELINPFVTSRSRGAGLGLFLAQKIAVAHGGNISLYSPPKGAGVKISLPQKRIRQA
ncbi:MAG: HAMP domain-containing histidine kinase [Nitrospirae bacterium]|nr:MAG: HAMP domain-containing histidine kinase [Nitrospirota bacterium]